ncbi:MAG TPA: MFS transporter, partial [Solirubrobacteraceae bacterium]|nr:MFS transporter [Solirubrobacteraceae bacterium]
MNSTSTDRRRWIALGLLATAQFVVVLDASIVNVALPSIGRALHFSQDSLSWVVNAYVLTFGGFLLLGGRLADLLGRRRVFIAGLIIFAIASLAGGLAQSEAWLIAARAVQGLGAAILSPAALSIVTNTFREGAERNRALGVWGAVAGSGGAAGVLLGGVLTDSLGWEWVLYVNFPIGILAALLAPRLIDESRAEGERRAFDVAGAVTVTAGLSVLVYALVDAQNAGWGSFQTVGLLGLSVALLAAFTLIETRAAAPLVPFRIFKSRTLTGANVSGLLIGASLFSMFFFLSLYMQQVLGYDALKTGFAYLPLALTIIVAAGITSTLVTRTGFKPSLAAGMAFITVGLLWFTQVSVDGTYLVDVLPGAILVALGLGFAFVSVTVAATSKVTSAEAGLASGLINTSQQIGGALGLAILSAVATARTDAFAPGVASQGREGAILALNEG